MFRPVHRWFQMVGDMVSIVPALPVVPAVDASHAVFIGISRIPGIYKSMLCPVSEHSDEAVKEIGENKHAEGSGPVKARQYDTENDEKYLSTYCAVHQLFPVLSFEVGSQVVDPPDHKHK